MNLTEEHIEVLREVIRRHSHSQITPEIRRELQHAQENASHFQATGTNLPQDDDDDDEEDEIMQ